MADARRIIFGTYVVPQEGHALEESIPSKYILLQQDTSGDVVAKTLGGKGHVTTAQIQTTQWSDTWVSFAHQQMNWEDWDDDNDIYGNWWEDCQEPWNGILSVGTSKIQLASGHTTDSVNNLVVDKDLAFVYVKNLGADNNVYLSCTAGGGSGYNIVIPPGGSVQFRGGGTHCDDIYVKCASGQSSTIEYILAKSEA